MDYELVIKETNVAAHLDIEKEISNKKNGQMTFTLRIDKGNISDFTVVEYVNINDYLRLKSITIQEYTVAHDTHQRNK